MSNSIIEDSRQISEDLDLYETTLTKLLLLLENPLISHRNKLINSFKAKDLIERIISSSELLNQLLDKENEERILEIEALTGNSTVNDELIGGDLSEFYKRLGKVKDYHRKYPEIASTSNLKYDKSLDFTALEEGGNEEWLDKKFTAEEGLGRYLDLHQLHELWNNLSSLNSSGTLQSGGWKRLTYLQYLESLTTFNTSFTLSLKIKSTTEYSNYLIQLLQYLSDFYEKVFPLGDLDSILNATDSLFAKKWDMGTVEGWSNIEESNNNNDEADNEQGIWCAACQKQYSKQTVYNAHLTSKKHIKASTKSTSDPSTTILTPIVQTAASLLLQRQQKHRALALKEYLINSLVSNTITPPGPLASILSDTLSNNERRAALTDRERATEMEELEAREAAEAQEAALNSTRDKMALTTTNNNGEDEDDDEGRIYNPLKLPMGWDGKPIPFWLFKLHGLGVEYKCEICSDFVYMGRKNFERHFQEPKHAFGMRALGLPNTKHFHEITKIEDAIALAEKLKQEGQKESIQAGMTEELEDDDGNVYNRKTYDDLKRQGLL